MFSKIFFAVPSLLKIKERMLFQITFIFNLFKITIMRQYAQKTGQNWAGIKILLQTFHLKWTQFVKLLPKILKNQF
jgi:hypothetical protein